MLALAGCFPILEAGGQRTALAVDVRFVRADQTPVVDAPVYIAERIGSGEIVTEVLKTDAHGQVFLRGSFCLPAFVAARGGGVAVQQETLVPAYQVTVKEGNQPSLDHLFGKPDSKYLGYSRTHTDCG